MAIILTLFSSFRKQTISCHHFFVCSGCCVHILAKFFIEITDIIKPGQPRNFPDISWTLPQKPHTFAYPVFIQIIHNGTPCNFNTSHVTVYRIYIPASVQYINEFQYIPCYGLSVSAAIKAVGISHFNTSHVTVYPDRLFPLEEYFHNFNTSHVTVYLKWHAETFRIKQFQYISCYGLSRKHRITTGRENISIHLMLRFIGKVCERLHCGATFQYISCYGLSKLFVAVKVWYPNFNTSHVTVYRRRRIKLEGTKIFQYISCYGLSGYLIDPDTGDLIFQYISCYGLSLILW